MSLVEQSSRSMTAEEFGERLFGSALGLIETLSIYVGDRMGWYRALAESGPATAGELVARTGGSERYAREWLEQQAVNGILEVEETDERRFAITPAVAEVTTDPSSLSFLSPLARMVTASAIQMPKLMDAYKNGGGVNWAEFGEDARESQSDMNRPWFENVLPDALRGVPEIHDVLSRPAARIADIGPGGGWSSLALARAYPNASVEGFDIDRPAVEMATKNAQEAGVADRVTFHVADGADMGAQEYDAIFAFECIHDMSHPVEVLAAAGRALKPDGAMVVMDEAVADRFTAPGDEVERLMYGFSLFLCLPDGLSHEGSVGTGTVMRRATLERYARAAGFSRVSVLPIEDFGFWRFYRLHL